MPAQSWNVTVKTETEKRTEKHSVFAPDPQNARDQLERRGYVVLDVKIGYFWTNVNYSAEFKNL